MTDVEDAGNSIFNSLAHCQQGGFIATGSEMYSGQPALILVRFDDFGVKMWRNLVHDFMTQIGMEVIECRSGGYAIVGYVSENNGDALLLRTDEFGRETWVRTFGRVTQPDRGAALVECQSGGFAFAGTVRNANFTNSDYWLVRTDYQGHILWERFYGGLRDDVCHSLVESEDGGFVLGGSTKSYGHGNEDAWILRTNSDGDVLWNTTFGGLRTEIGYDIIPTHTGDFVFVGETATNGNLVSDGFAATIHGNGTLLWNVTFGGVSRSRAYGVAECFDGSLAVTGQTVDWVGNSQYYNLWLVRLSGEGEFWWSKTYGGQRSDEGRSILQTENGDFIIVGQSNSILDHGTAAWGLRVPDIPPLPIDTRIYGPPNFFFIGIGTGLSVLVISGSYFLFYRSRKEIALPWTKPSRMAIRKSFLAPRLIEDLASILTGLRKCTNCNEISMNEKARCSKCRHPLHRCLLCDEAIRQDDLITFCPGCNVLAHHSHMTEWLEKRQYCPRCGIQLPIEQSTLVQS